MEKQIEIGAIVQQYFVKSKRLPRYKYLSRVGIWQGTHLSNSVLEYLAKVMLVYFDTY